MGINKLAAVGPMLCWFEVKVSPGEPSPFGPPPPPADECLPPPPPLFPPIGITPTFKLIVGIWPTGIDALPSGLLAGGWACDKAALMLCDWWWPRKERKEIGVNIAAAAACWCICCACWWCGWWWWGWWCCGCKWAWWCGCIGWCWKCPGRCADRWPFVGLCELCDCCCCWCGVCGGGTCCTRAWDNTWPAAVALVNGYVGEVGICVWPSGWKTVAACGWCGIVMSIFCRGTPHGRYHEPGWWCCMVLGDRYNSLVEGNGDVVLHATLFYLATLSSIETRRHSWVVVCWRVPHTSLFRIHIKWVQHNLTRRWICWW